MKSHCNELRGSVYFLSNNYYMKYTLLLHLIRIDLNLKLKHKIIQNLNLKLVLKKICKKCIIIKQIHYERA